MWDLDTLLVLSGGPDPLCGCGVDVAGSGTLGLIYPDAAAGCGPAPDCDDLPSTNPCVDEEYSMTPYAPATVYIDVDQTAPTISIEVVP